MLRHTCLAFVLSSCTSVVPDGACRDQLLELHEAQRRAHLDEDAVGLVELFDDSFFEVRDGVVMQPSRAASLARLQRYFGLVEFLAWEDIAPPRIEVSRDGSLATMAVQKLVRVKTQDADDASRIERAQFAWTATCVRRESGWRIASVTSTRRPQDAAHSLAALQRSLGGEPLIARLNRADAAFACKGPIGNYRLEMELPRDGTWRLSWIFPGGVDQRFELQGAQAWSVDAAGSRSLLGAAELAALRSHAFPWLALDPSTCFSQLAHAGTRLDSGRTLERLAMTDAAGQAALAEIDLADDLLFGVEVADTRTQPPAPITIRFPSWRRVDGLLLPEQIVVVDGRGTWTMELESARLAFDPD